MYDLHRVLLLLLLLLLLSLTFQLILAPFLYIPMIFATNEVNVFRLHL